MKPITKTKRIALLSCWVRDSGQWDMTVAAITDYFSDDYSKLIAHEFHFRINNVFQFKQCTQTNMAKDGTVYVNQTKGDIADLFYKDIEEFTIKIRQRFLGPRDKEDEFIHAVTENSLKYLLDAERLRKPNNT